MWQEKMQEQFNIRCDDFNVSANWITDAELIHSHVDIAGIPRGEMLDLCCGTGRVGRAFKAAGWNVVGLDITENMIRAASAVFPVVRGSADALPFDAARFELVVCRQAFQFLDAQNVLSEIRRVLKPGGTLILSQTVPFSEKDRPWLEKIHKTKQALLLRFFTFEDLLGEIESASFIVEDTRTLEVRESITRWMAYAPEVSPDIRAEVCSLVKDAPSPYRELHHVEEAGGEICEDWHWVVIRARTPGESREQSR